MKIDATADQIRALLSLVARDETARDPVDRPQRTNDAEAARRGLPPLVLERYDALSAAGRQPPVASIERGTCSGCHLRLPTMVESKAAHALALYTCPHCRRMLYTRALLQQDSDAGCAKPSRRKQRTAAEIRPS